jgi:hypothetical protein
MGKRLLNYFSEADRLGGLVARMRLASMAQITSTEAGAVGDRADIIDRMDRALEVLRGEFGKAAPESSTPRELIATAPAGDDRT